MKRQIWLGSAAFALTLLVLFPVRWASAWLPSQVQCDAWRGSVWRGECKGLVLTLPGTAPLLATTFGWKLHPISLLRMRLRASIDVQNSQGSGSAVVEAGRGGFIAVNELSATATFDRQLATMLPAGWSGQLQARQLVLHLQGNQLLQLAGEILLHDFHDDRGNSFGSYQLVFAPMPAPPFEGALKDSGGPLQVAASLTITGDRRWKLEGTAAPRGDSPTLRKQLELLGGPDGNGLYPLRAEGSFK